uniref:C2H2-type domain-containing protein n=1 Tax=Lygus hesperus TaxID=30085 RepID=A0A0K8TGM9_LYGHE
MTCRRQKSKMKVKTSIRPTHPRKVKNPPQPNEKKPEEKKNASSSNTNGGAGSTAPKVVRSHTKRLDMFELQKPFVTSFSCVSDVVKAFNNGTDELRNLINFECDLIYECKVCRSLFRSLANFLQHKRSHCLESARDLKKNILNGEVTDKLVHINGTNPKGQLLATRKTMRKDIYDILRKVGDLTEEPLPEQFFTRDIQETDAALLSFFKQEGKAATEERSATLGSDGYVMGAKSSGRIAADKLTPKVIRSSVVNPDVSSKQSDASSRQSEASSRQSDVNSRPTKSDSRPASTFKCLKCDEIFSSPSELSAHSNLRNCSKLRRCYVCPLCKKIVATPWNVYRHIRRVHNKTVEQVRKLRKNIEKRMVRAEEIKTRSPPSPVRKPVVTEKTQELIRSYENANHMSVGLNCGQSQLMTPVLFKRGRSPEADVTVKNRILEVRSYDKTLLSSPPKNGLDSTLTKGTHSEVSVSARILNSPQPRVMLTKTHLTPMMCASLIVNQAPTTSPQSVPNSSSSTDPQPHATKKIKIEKDLSWLKKGPSVPIVGGPLTRTARALYGSPRKINPTESDKVEWNKSRGNINGEDIRKEEAESNEVGPCRSTRDESSENEVENPSGPEEGSPSDGEDHDSDNASDSEEKKPKDTSSLINKRLSSSEDNVRSLTSSVDSFDSTPSKGKTAVQDLQDQTSTSGVETEVDRPTTTPTSSAGASEDESADVDLLVGMYSKHAPPPPLTIPDAYPSNQSSSDYLELMKERLADTHDEASCQNNSPNITRDAVLSASANNNKPAAPSARRKSTESMLLLSKSPPREANETEHSSCDLASSFEAPEEVKPFLDSDDSNSAKEEEQDEQLRQNMMEVIFGTLPTTSFNFTCVRDISSS